MQDNYVQRRKALIAGRPKSYREARTSALVRQLYTYIDRAALNRNTSVDLGGHRFDIVWMYSRSRGTFVTMKCDGKCIRPHDAVWLLYEIDTQRTTTCQEVTP